MGRIGTGRARRIRTGVRGAAPDAQPQTGTTTATLRAKRDELAEAERALAAAETALDVDAEIAARERVAVLRRHVATLASADADAAQTMWKERAAAIVETYRDTDAEARRALDAQADAARKEIARVAQVTEDVVRAYNALVARRRELDFIRLRFPDLCVSDLPALPEPPSVASAVFEVEAAGFARYRPLRAAGTANATREELEREGYRLLAQHLKKVGRSLSPDVRALFEAVGVPDAELPERRAALTERQERESAAMAKFARDVARAPIPGSATL